MYGFGYLLWAGSQLQARAKVLQGLSMALLVYCTGSCFPVASVLHRVLQGFCKGSVGSMLGYCTEYARKVLRYCWGPAQVLCPPAQVPNPFLISGGYMKTIANA